MSTFDIRDVPFFHLSDEIPFLNGTLPSLSNFINGDYVKILLLVFILLYVIGYCIIAGIVFYHWNTYGMKTKSILLAKSIFTLMSLFLLTVLVGLVLSL